MGRGLQVANPCIANLRIVDMRPHERGQILTGRDPVPHQGQRFALRQGRQVPALGGDLR